MPVIKPIRIVVKNRYVALEGVVDNRTDKDLAALRANGVSSVFSLTNNRTVAARPLSLVTLRHPEAA